jgi:hypothetical protein
LFALQGRVLLQMITRGVLVLIPLMVGAVRIHAHPSAAAQEMSRCLGVMRIVAARERSGTAHHGPVSATSGGDPGIS